MDEGAAAGSSGSSGLAAGSSGSSEKEDEEELERLLAAVVHKGVSQAQDQVCLCAWGGGNKMCIAVVLRTVEGIMEL